MRLVLRAGFDRWSGYGNDAVDLALQLGKLGLDVVPWPLSLLPPLPPEFTRLLEKDPGRRPDAVLQFSDPASFEDMPAWADGPAAFGYSMWERLPLLPTDLWYRDGETFDGEPARAVADRPFSRYLRGMAVTCPMNLDAFRHVDPGLAMTVVPCGIEPDDWPVADRRRSDRPFRFLMIGVLNGRKDPFCVLQAWQWLKANHLGFDAELIVHTFTPGLPPKVAEVYGPGIRFSGQPLTRAELVELYHSADVLVSPSRGEGNNKPAMEFMATGGTVLASEWSGHLNWMTEDATYALPGELRPCEAQPAAVEYVVDPMDCARIMLGIWDDQRLAHRKGARAADWIRERCAWQVLLPKLVDWMAET